jgi:hypothetical protein
MNPRLVKTLGSILAAGLLPAAAAVPAPWGAVAVAMSAALLSALHIKRPGDVSG